MSYTRTSRTGDDPDLSTGGRLAAAFGSLLFSVPVMGLLWLLFNSQLAFSADWVIPFPYLVAAVLGFAVLSFCWPRLAPDVFGRLCELLGTLVRWWW